MHRNRNVSGHELQHQLRFLARGNSVPTMEFYSEIFTIISRLAYTINCILKTILNIYHYY